MQAPGARYGVPCTVIRITVIRITVTVTVTVTVNGPVQQLSNPQLEGVTGVHAFITSLRTCLS